MQQYKQAMDQVQFSKNFEEATIKKLALAETGKEKMRTPGKLRLLKSAAIVAAIIVVFTFGAQAISQMLSAQEVAEITGNEQLAKAFRSGGAKAVNETHTLGDYQVTLLGLANGKGLSQLSGDVDKDKSYIVLAASKLDGSPYGMIRLDEGEPFDPENLPKSTDTLFTSVLLVSGVAPDATGLDAATVLYFMDSNTVYFLLESDNLKQFSGKKIQLAVYDQSLGGPDSEIFVTDSLGDYAFAESIDALHTMFTLDF